MSFQKIGKGYGGETARRAPANFPILESVQADRQTLLLEHIYRFGLAQFVVRSPFFQSFDQRCNRVGDALFIAEVGQNNKDAIDPLPVFIKERRTFFCISPSLHAAEFRRLLVKNYGFDTALREDLQDIVAALSDQGIWKKIPVAYYDAESNRSILGHKNCRGWGG
jgi:hypothetical protein